MLRFCVKSIGKPSNRKMHSETNNITGEIRNNSRDAKRKSKIRMEKYVFVGKVIKVTSEKRKKGEKLVEGAGIKYFYTMEVEKNYKK